jgi:hypothetical protein
MAKRGEWSRWGRGACEGWSLEIGIAFRGSVVRQERINEPPTWLASINASYVGEYPDRALAMKHVEENIRNHMELVLHDWRLYQAVRETG